MEVKKYVALISVQFEEEGWVQAKQYAEHLTSVLYRYDPVKIIDTEYEDLFDHD